MKTKLTTYAMFAGFSLLANLAPAQQPLRREVNTLTAAEIATLQRGIDVMRERSRKNPGDPRGYEFWADIHRQYCTPAGVAGKIHFGWEFLPWHRAYLYYFEQTLQEAAQDTRLRLPYWDWTVHRSPPAAFYGSSNTLNHPGRKLSPPAELNAQRVDVSLAMGEPSFRGFGGWGLNPDPNSFTGLMEVGPHANVHGDLGGDMGRLASSARDPLFWLHHANIDRLWDEWLRNGHRNPTEPRWLDLRMSFPAAGTPVTVTVAEILRLSANQYASSPAASIEAPPLAPQKAAVRVRVFSSTEIERQSAVIADLPDGPQFILRGVEIPTDAPISASLFVADEAADDKTPRTKERGFAGIITLLPAESGPDGKPVKTNLVVSPGRRAFKTSKPGLMSVDNITVPTLTVISETADPSEVPVRAIKIERVELHIPDERTRDR